MITWDIRTRIYVLVAVCSSLSLLPLFWLVDWEIQYIGALGLAIVILSLLAARLLFKDVKSGLLALETGLLNLKDGEFSTTISHNESDELGRMCDLYNQTVDTLRKEKHWIYQRELLLDKIIQSSPDVLFLVNDNSQVVFSNYAARHFFNVGTRVEGRSLSELLLEAPSGVNEAVDTGKEGLFSINTNGGEPQTWHLSKGTFLLNNQSHNLYILKQMTRELSRQEVAVWKKVIRVISHELNNSIGPISSMLHSGRILSANLNEDRLNRVFDTIDDRMNHLSEFVQGYGKFAKIPEPKIEAIDTHLLFSQLAQQWQFKLQKNGVERLEADPSQLEQLLINLLKNAHESGTAPGQVAIELTQDTRYTTINVSDRGKGIAESRLQSVLIPFYSTKSAGTGLGLALCREIVDAHHGNIVLQNRDGGGLVVKVLLPRLQVS